MRKTPPAAAAKLTPTSLLATQRLLMATPAKRQLDFEGVASPNGSKKVSSSSLVGCDKIDEPGESPVQANEYFKLCKENHELSGGAFQSSNVVSQKIKEFTPVKEEEIGTSDISENDKIQNRLEKESSDEKKGVETIKSGTTIDKVPRNYLDNSSNTEDNKDVVKNITESDLEKNECANQLECVIKSSAESNQKLVDCSVVSKLKNEQNVNLKTAASPKNSVNHPSKGYSAVTKASMNRAKTNSMAVNSNILPGSIASNSKGSSNNRATGTNTSCKTGSYGSRVTPNTVSGNKSMSSSTSSTVSTTEVAATTSQTSLNTEKLVTTSSKSSASILSGNLKKTSNTKVVAAANANSNNSSGNTGENSPKAQRLSLVQRQAKFAVSASTSSNTTLSTKGSMTRSATTPSLNYKGRGTAIHSTRPQSAKLTTAKYTANKGIITSNRNHAPLKSSNSTPLANLSNPKTSIHGTGNQTSGLQPFGSTSSISSSGSSRSWADTVKGLKMTTNAPSNAKSAENISTKNASHEQNCSNNIEEKSLPGNQDEGGEWETVRPRTRSRISPINSQVMKSRASLSTSNRVSSELKRSSSFNESTAESIMLRKEKKVSNKNTGSSNTAINHSKQITKTNQNVGLGGKASKQYNKDRFQLPSSAVSMPSLAVVDNGIASQTKSNVTIKAKKEKQSASMSKSSDKGSNIKDKRNKDSRNTDNNNKNSTSHAIISESTSSSESLEDKGSKASVKSNKTSLQNRTSLNNRGDFSTKERSRISTKKDKKLKNSNSDVSKPNSPFISSRDAIDKAHDHSMPSMKDYNINNNEAQNGLENKSDSDKSDNKENIPLGKIVSECIVSPYPHQLDTCLEDDESEGDTAENEADSELAENEAAIALVEEEEESLAREIKETECSQLADDALDSANECDNHEIMNKQEEENTSVSIKQNSTICKDSEINSEDLTVQESNEPCTPSKYEALFEGLSWIEQIELEEQLVEARMPGRAIEIHEKLSSPARKREPHEAFKHHQEKQNKARVRRQMFQDEKAQRLVALNTRIEEVIAHREFLLSKRREMIMKKMAKAEAKRQEHIEGIRKKAGEEEAKLKEIAFINELSAQNTRFDMLAQNQAADEKAEERLAEFANERAKKADQREAKEARAEERRRKLEDKRIKDVEALRIKILRREERIQEEQEQIRKDREEAAREKNRDREEKLSTVRAAEKDMKEELQEKIQQKMEEAAKRHQEKLQQVRHKAFELSIKTCSTEEGELEGDALLHPMLLAYDPKKKCEVCGVLIHNEVQLQSHLRGKKHAEQLRNFVIAENQGNSSRPSSSENLTTEKRKMSGEEVQKYNLRYIVDAPVDELDPKMIQLKERNKAMKKRAKKIKTRMAVRAAEYEKMLQSEITSSKISDGPHKAKIGKSLRDIEKLLISQGKGAWPNNSVSSLDRALGEIMRSFQNSKLNGHKESQPHEKLLAMIAQDKHAFFDMNGFNTLSKLFQLLADATPSTGMKIDQRPVCVIPLKSIVLSCKTWTSACSGHRNNTEFVLKSNYLSTISDILLHRLHILIPETSKNSSKKKSDTDSLGDQLPAPEGPQVDPVAKEIMISLAQSLEDLAAHLIMDHENNMKDPKPNGHIKKTSAFNDLALRVHDQVSYMIAIGIVDKLAAYFHSVQDPIDDRPEVGEFLLASLDLMSALTVCVEALSTKSANSASNLDATSKAPYRDMSSSSSVADGVEGSNSSNSGKLIFIVI